MSKSKKSETAIFDVASFLQTPEDIAEYLAAVLETGDTTAIVLAIGHAARAIGMANIASKANLGRESLYKSLSENGNPSFDTILKVMGAMGVRLSASPVHQESA